MGLHLIVKVCAQHGPSAAACKVYRLSRSHFLCSVLASFSTARTVSDSGVCAQTSLSLPFITATAEGPKHIETNLTRAKFEEIASDLLERCRIPVQQALKDANLKVSDLHEVILVGGSTRIPAVQVPANSLCSICPSKIPRLGEGVALQTVYILALKFCD